MPNWTLATEVLAWLDAECPYPPLPAAAPAVNAVYARRRELLSALDLGPLTLMRVKCDELQQGWRRR